MPAFHRPLIITNTIADNVTSPWTDERIIFFPQPSGRSQKLRLNALLLAGLLAPEKLAHWDEREARGLGAKCGADRIPDICGGRGGMKIPETVVIKASKLLQGFYCWVTSLRVDLDSEA